ncbi:MAG TPA: STAS domain-containing protein [Syntrophales bacterium]|nr:STAS domain-containing protein [Syntrophales bacterium]
MSSSKIGIMKAGANNILIPKDMLTFKNCDDLEHVSDALVKQKSGIVLDCKSVSLMDSKALELLLRMHDAMKSRGQKLKICGLNAGAAAYAAAPCRCMRAALVHFSRLPHC